MTGTGQEVANVLEDAAKKIGPALAEDFSGAYKNVLHDTKSGLENNARHVSENESTLTENFGGVKPQDDSPKIRGGSGSDTPHGSSGSAGPEKVPLNEVGHPHAESTPAGDRPSGGDPVDLVTGEMFLVQSDLELPGVLPLLLERVHMSGYRKGRWFGRSWASSFDQRVEVDDDGIHYAAPDGVVLHYPVPTRPGRLVMPSEGSRWPLRWDREGDTIVIEQPELGRSLSFPPGPTPDLARPLAAVVDRNGNRVMFTYDGEGVPTDVYHSGGHHVTVESRQTSAGIRINGLQLVDPRSGGPTRLVSFGYDARGRLTDTVNSSGLPLVFEYDDEDRITAWTDRNGRRYEYHFDASGRVARTDGSGGFLTASFDYDLDNRITTFTDSLGHTTLHHWNERNQIVKVLDARGGETLIERDRYGRLLSSTDPLGRTVRVRRDEVGDPARIERADGAILDLAYAGATLSPTSLAGPEGVWQYEYDERGNMTVLTDPAGAVTHYEYGERGDLTAVTDPLGQVTRYRNDKAGLPIAVTAPSGATSVIERDAFGRIIAVTDALGTVVRSGWTVDGDQAWLAMPDGTREEWEYDPEGNTILHRGRHGAETRYEYGAFDSMVARIDADGACYAFTYDTEMRLTAVTNAQSLEWRYEYGAAGDLLSETDFDGRTLRYAYDGAGRLVERVNGAGQSTVFERDELDRIVERRAGESVYAIGYDLAGRVTSAHGPDTRIEYVRDAAGRVLAETVNGRTMAYEYDALGRVLSRTTPTGAVSRWTYDAAGLPVELAAAGQALVFHRDPAGRETGRTIGGVAAVSQGFDELGRMTAQAIWAYDRPGSDHAADSAHRVVQHRTYSYRADGTPLEVADHLRGTRRYDLDPMGRVTAVHAAAWTETYAYDADGNLSRAGTTPSPDGEETDGERDYAGTVIRRAGRTSYEHDAQGRMLRRTRRTLSGQVRKWTYAWDADDRLTSVTTPDGTTWQYTYDALGRRIAKRRLTRDGGTAEEIWFSWDGEHLAEQAAVSADGSADVLTWDWEPQTHRVAAQTRRTWATGAEQAAIDAEFYAIVTDLVGSPTELVSAADGTIAWLLTTSLWGGPVEAGNSRADTDCPLRFPGQYLDAETGLHYNVLRYYDPATGGYASPDPLGLAAAPNHHAYVDNPLIWLDPLGLMGACMSKSSAEDVQEEGAFRPQANHSKQTKFTGKVFNRVPRYVYRMDTRTPTEIAATGFAPREGAAGNLTLWGHVSRTYPDKPGFSRDDSQWISTGRNDMLNDGIIATMTQTHTLYRIDSSRTGGRFADVNRTFGDDHEYANQNEYAHENAIPPEAITHYMTGEDARNHLLDAMGADGRGRLNLDNLPPGAWTEMPPHTPEPENSGAGTSSEAGRPSA